MDFICDLSGVLTEAEQICDNDIFAVIQNNVKGKDGDRGYKYFAVVNEDDGNQMQRYLNDNNCKFIMADDAPFTDCIFFICKCKFLTLVICNESHFKAIYLLLLLLSTLTTCNCGNIKVSSVLFPTLMTYSWSSLDLNTCKIKEMLTHVLSKEISGGESFTRWLICSPHPPRPPLPPSPSCHLSLHLLGSHAPITL